MRELGVCICAYIEQAFKCMCVSFMYVCVLCEHMCICVRTHAGLLCASVCEYASMCVFVHMCARSLVAQLVESPPAMWETPVQPLGREDPLEKGTATHSSVLAWRVPWTVQQRAAHDRAMSFLCRHAQCMCTCVSVFVCLHPSVCLHACMYVCIYVFAVPSSVFVHVCLCVCKHNCVSVCLDRRLSSHCL